MQCKKYVMKAVSGRMHPRCCSKKAKFFLRATYLFVRSHYENGKNADAFGFCPECAQGMDNVANWKIGWTAGSILRLRGPVASVESCTEEEASGERLAGEHADLKARIKIIMRQKNHVKIEPETWAEIFSDCVDEYIVEAVQNA